MPALVPCRFRKFLTLALGCVAAVTLAGCRPEPQITSYSAPKDVVVTPAKGGPSAKMPQAPAGPRQTLAAIFVAGDSGWFFKATGAPAQIAPLEADVRTFLASVRFKEGADAEPTWTLPAGWQEEAGNAFRYRTLRMGDSSSAPELTISKLSGPEAGGLETYLLSNINRWRDQVGLPKLEAAELPKNSEKIKAGELEGTLVNLIGEASGNSSMAPFAGGNRPLPTPPDQMPTAEAPPANGQSKGLQYTAPAGWEPTPPDSMRRAAFAIAGDGKKAEVTVIPLGAAAGDLLSNINRWRGQIGLPEISQSELDPQLEPIEMGTAPGKFIEIAGANETILGAIAVDGGKAWFVKFRGDAALAQREKQAFKEFVKSIRFE